MEGKIVIQEVLDVEKGMEISVPMDSSLHLSGMKAYIATVKKDKSNSRTSPASESENLEAPEEDEDEDRQEFIKKWQIRPGLHLLHSEHGMLVVPFNEEKYFETQTSKKLVEIFELFYKNIHIARKYKKMKRAYLLHSDPGMGKSALIRRFCRSALEKEGIAIVQVDGEINFNLLTHIFMNDYHQDVKLIILIIEDMGRKDYAANMHIYNASCLNFLDGNNALYRVPTLVLCTTNYAKELGPHFTNRPGRFNKIIKVLPPTDEEIFELVEGFGEITLTGAQKQAFVGKNLTPDHCIEAIVRHELEEIDLEEAITDIIKEREGLINFDR